MKNTYELEYKGYTCSVQEKEDGCKGRSKIFKGMYFTVSGKTRQELTRSFQRMVDKLLIAMDERALSSYAAF